VAVQPEGRVERRLAAVLAADVAGYSRLMGADEVDTLQRLRGHRSQLIDPKIREHHGRIVKTTGDGMLVEFASVVDAVRCAVEVQRGMADRNSDTPEDQRICFRVGINLGDVIIDGDDIHGDGVNVAARLEGLAEPGGLCVSRTVRNQVRDKLPYIFEDMGEQSVKNIARPVRVDALTAAAVAETPLVPPQLQPQPSPARRSRPPPFALIAASLVAIVIIGLGAWWVWPHAGSVPASVQAPTNPQASPVAGTTATPAPRLSIVVLPFANQLNDPEQDYFVDGITDDLTTDLSHITGSFVIARTTAFTYKGKAVDVKEIGRDLGVRYVLEGSVRRDGEQVQVNVQLIDAESGAHVWADRFDTDRSNLSKAQDEIVARLARALQLELVEAASRRMEQEKPANPDASDFVMRGWAWYQRPNTDISLQEAQRAFERALELDPQSVDAKVGLANVLTEFIANGRSHMVNGVSISPAQDLARSEQLLIEAIERDGNNPRALYGMGRVRYFQNRLPEAQIDLEKAMELDPNNSITSQVYGIVLLNLGYPEAAIPYIERRIRLDPYSPNTFFAYWWLGCAHLLMGQADEAVTFYRKARAGNSRFPPTSLFLAAALGLRGDLDEAKAALADAIKLKPQYKSFSDLLNLPNFKIGSPLHFDQLKKTFEVGLRRAGMPDE
jgi:adenylate cyclase